MPLSSAQLAALVERAKAKTPPVVSPPPSPRWKLSDNPSKAPVPAGRATAQNAQPDLEPPPQVPAPPPVSPAEAEDFPIGWELRKESWHIHRRFYAIFRRPMHRGEYSHLIWQIRRGKAEHLSEDYWLVTLPNGRTLPVRVTPWRLITILPKNWQPPTAAE